MALTVFWVKVILKRILGFFKSSPVTVICALLFIGSIIYAFASNNITIQIDSKRLVLVSSLLMVFSIFNSYKNHNVLLYLIKFSKSRYSNLTIYIRYFLLQALKNNILLLAFCVFIFKFLTSGYHLFFLLEITAFSVFISFLIMYFRYFYFVKKPENEKNTQSTPVLKSSFYDYSAVVSTAMLCLALFAIILFDFFSHVDIFSETKYQSIFFIVTTIIFAIGFTGITGAIPKINWKFQAIISHNTYKYHFLRTSLFTCAIFSFLFITFCIIGANINPALFFKYLICILLLLITAINISFTAVHILIKLIIILVITALTVWISILPSYYLPALIIPVLLTYLKAKHEYREWSAA